MTDACEYDTGFAANGASVIDDVQDNSLRNEGGFSEWHYPLDLFEFYDSATMHTKPAKRPLKQVLGRLGIAFAVLVALTGLAWFGWMIHDYRKTHSEDSSQYLASQLPRIPAQPWSAPLYHDQAVTQHLQVYCIALEAPEKCRRITEQGARYQLEDDVCRDIATNGPAYDPYKPEKHNDQPQAPQQAPSAPQVAQAGIDGQSSWRAGVGRMPISLPAPCCGTQIHGVLGRGQVTVSSLLLIRFWNGSRNIETII